MGKHGLYGKSNSCSPYGTISRHNVLCTSTIEIPQSLLGINQSLHFVIDCDSPTVHGQHHSINLLTDLFYLIRYDHNYLSAEFIYAGFHSK